MSRVLSGIQPTGNLHLGNYLGAIAQWIPLQSQHECFFCIVDLHALTVPQDPKLLSRWTQEVAALYLASGIDPEKCVLFPQSAVATHSQLSWLLGCLTPMGWLNRMTQFKEKAGKASEKASLGLYAYPVLMAADILVYKATHVPVGEDQKQHLELARDIAQTFNHRYGTPFFPLPEPLIMGPAPRVMSLKDGKVKMSKSDAAEGSRINLLDSPDTIALKIRKAKTDPEPLGLPKDMKGRPEALNLEAILAALSGQTLDQVGLFYEGKLFTELKRDLTEVIVAHLKPLQEKFKILMQAPEAIEEILQRGALKAQALTSQHLKKTHEIMGLF